MTEWGEATLRAGYSLLLDATFLQRSARKRALAMAERVGVPPLILSIHCDEATTQRRIKDRLHAAQDASEATYAVYLRQKDTEDPLTQEEQAITTVLNSSTAIDGDSLLDTIRSRQSA
jgi:predicted kinase